MDNAQFQYLFSIYSFNYLFLRRIMHEPERAGTFNKDAVNDLFTQVKIMLVPVSVTRKTEGSDYISGVVQRNNLGKS